MTAFSVEEDPIIDAGRVRVTHENEWVGVGV
jgi:hypothetical protein